VKTLKTAVVGAGIYGVNHIEVYLQNPHVTLAAVCDLNEETRRKISEKYKVKTYADLQEMLDAESPDAVSIATPDNFHLEPALACIEREIPILVEKPLATTAEDCRKIIQAAKKHNTRVAVDFHKRWDPAAIRIYNLLRQSKGYPIRGYMNMDDIIDVPTKWFKWTNTSSPVDFLGSHCVDLIRWYMGCEATEVYAVGTKKLLASQGIDTYDNIQSIITFENGATWTVENSWVLPSGFAKNNDGRTSILTSEFLIRADSQDRGLQIFDSQKQSTPNVYFFNEFNGKIFGFGADPINSFIDCIINKKDFVACAIDGLEAAKITEAIHLSVETKTPVKIEREI